MENHYAFRYQPYYLKTKQLLFLLVSLWMTSKYRILMLRQKECNRCLKMQVRCLNVFKNGEIKILYFTKSRQKHNIGITNSKIICALDEVLHFKMGSFRGKDYEQLIDQKNFFQKP